MIKGQAASLKMWKALNQDARVPKLKDNNKEAY